MPPQRPRTTRHPNMALLRNRKPSGTINSPLLSHRYNIPASAMGGGGGGGATSSLAFALPQQQQQSVIIPIMCPVPVPMQQWQPAHSAALQDAVNLGKSAGARPGGVVSAFPSGNQQQSSWPLLPNQASAPSLGGITPFGQPAFSLPPGMGRAAAVPDVAMSRQQRNRSAPPAPRDDPEEQFLLQHFGFAPPPELTTEQEQEEPPFPDDTEYSKKSDQIKAAAANKYGEVWDSMFDQLVRYKLEHGDCLVPTYYSKNPKLGRWVMNQRHKKWQLSVERTERLNALGFTWCIKQQESWEAMFERLTKFKEQHGHCLVPQKHAEDSRLGEWVQTQRRDKKRRKNLSPEREAKLDSLGFEWCPHKYIWDAMFKRLVKFKQIYGNCLVPRHWEEDAKLGRWVDQQRVKNKKGNLPPERKAKLEEIGFVWRMR